MSLKQITLFFIFVNNINCQELERDSRGLESAAFKAVLEIGRLISNIGGENPEENLKGIFDYIMKNITVFYFLILSLILLQFTSFLLTVYVFKHAEKRFQRKRFLNRIQLNNCDCELTTSNHDFSGPDTYI